MLKSVSCEKFKVKTITFHPGLNIVVGGKRGTNSIGKTTLLLILDFIYGGSDYITIATDAQKHLKNHEFRFVLEFEGKPYYFSRSTGNDKVVLQYDENGELSRSMKVSEYTSWLKEMYGITQESLTFRSLADIFFRIAGRENLDTKKPLAAAKHESESNAIGELLKMYNLYGPYSIRKKAYDAAKEEETTYKNGQKYHYIPVAHNDKEVKENEKRIQELNAEMEELSKKNSDGVLNLSAIQREQLAELSARHSALERQKNSYRTQLRAIQSNRNAGKRSFQRNLDELQRFFPDVDVEQIEKVESFHKRVSNILKDEFEEAEGQLKASIGMVDKDIKDLEMQMKEISDIPNVKEAFLKEYTAKEKERATLKAANDSRAKLQELQDTTKDQNKKLDAITMSLVSEVQAKINGCIAELSTEVFKESPHTPPVLQVEGVKKYNYFVEDDTGTGTAFASLIIFDLACMKMTNLPIIMHDSRLFDDIESDRVEHILDLYTQMPKDKQIFVTLDREGNYTEKARKLIHDHTNLHLERGGNELFGWSWASTSKKK